MTTFTLTTEQLHRLLKPTLLFCSSDDGLPILHTIRVLVEGTAISATATDRFKLGISRSELREAATGPEFLLHKDDAKRLLGAFKVTARTGHNKLELTVDEGSLKVRAIEGGTAFSCLTVEGDYPRTERLIENALGDKPGTTSAMLAPQHYKAVCLAAEALKVQGFSLRTGSSSLKPLLAFVGDNFLALVMPFRDDGYQAEQVDSWRQAVSV